MTINEVIAKEKENAEELRKIIETGYDGEISIEELFYDDTSVIKEAYERLENDAKECEQLAEWLEELKTIKEMDLSIPQHFTKEQSDWIKAYCIKRNIEFYNKAIDDLSNTLKENYDYLPQILSQEAFDRYIDEYGEQLKEGGNINE